ncbi:MAG: hypothetical protein H7A08_01045 [Oceanospirillaceae bacterium]|nr:hypothetical protein [Oceanospirillaceae bacterium]
MFRPAMWLGMVCLWLSTNVLAISAEEADSYLRQRVPPLAVKNRELRAIYYFGERHGITLIGLELVDANTYLPKRWLLVFRDEQLSGWYFPMDEFPRAMERGVITFPKGTGINPINIEQLGQPLLINNQPLDFTPWP